MLAAIAVIAIVAIRQNQPKAPIKSQLPAPSQPLWKPQPIDLLQDKRLTLSREQTAAIGKLDNEWRQEQVRLSEAMTAYQPKRGNADEVAASMREYSELSRGYDEARVRFWKKALEQLTPEQRSVAEVRK